MEKVDKTWGWEHWFANSELYCGKLIFINFNLWSSKGAFHYHKIKDETFFILNGCLTLQYYENNTKQTIKLHEGESFNLKPGIKHRFKTNTIKGCKFVETSTQHFDSDSYRCKLIDGKWIEKV